MREFKYRWLHLPTGKTGETIINSILSLAEFHALMVKWNNQQPKTWVYYPV